MADSSLAVDRIAESYQAIQVVLSHIQSPPHKGDQDFGTSTKCVSQIEFCLGISIAL